MREKEEGIMWGTREKKEGISRGQGRRRVGGRGRRG
jgi:hypothetical protein